MEYTGRRGAAVLNLQQEQLKTKTGEGSSVASCSRQESKEELFPDPSASNLRKQVYDNTSPQVHRASNGSSSCRARLRRRSISVPKTSDIRPLGAINEPGKDRQFSRPSIFPRESSSPTTEITSSENRIIINVGGVRFETYRTTLKNIPDTRLSWITEASSTPNCDYNADTGEYFFDRNSSVFDYILNYYRTGKLHTPMNVCGPMFEAELEFWGIDETQIEACCWPNYQTYRNAQRTLAELGSSNYDSDEDSHEEDSETAKRFGIEEESKPKNWFKRNQKQIWSCLEHDKKAGRKGKAIAWISITVILLSISLMCLETLPAFRTVDNSTFITRNNKTIEHSDMKVSYFLTISTPHISITIFDAIFNFYFTIEFLVRILFCPQKKEFFKQILNWIDILALVNTYIMYCVRYLLNNSEVVVWLQMVDSIRVFRIFKLTRHFSGLTILVHTMRASFKELILLSVVFLIFVIVFGTIVYITEQFLEVNGQNQIRNMPIGFWWALITMTSVGYGDFVPKTFPGYLAGVVCASSSVLLIALPVPVIVNNFTIFYTHAQARLKLPRKKRRVIVGVHHTISQNVTSEYSDSSSIASDKLNMSYEDSKVSTVNGSVSNEGSIGELNNFEKSRPRCRADSEPNTCTKKSSNTTVTRSASNRVTFQTKDIHNPSSDDDTVIV